MANKNKRRSHIQNFINRKEKNLRWTTILFFSLIVGFVVYFGADWYMSLPVVFKSASTGEVVKAEKNGTNYSIDEALKEKHLVKYVP